MNTEEVIEFERQLKLLGWRYEADVEQFFAGNRRLDWLVVVDLVPEKSREGLSEYQNQKREEWRRQQPSRQDDANSASDNSN